MADIEVQMGDIAVAKDKDNLIALGIGSCLVITFYDSKQKIGALAHTILPADTAIDEMVKRIEAQGAKKEFIEAKLIGAANMFSAFTSKIGEDNILYAREKLKKEGIAIVGECVGGSQGRSVEFSVATGIVTVKIKF